MNSQFSSSPSAISWNEFDPPGLGKDASTFGKPFSRTVWFYNWLYPMVTWLALIMLISGQTGLRQDFHTSYPPYPLQPKKSPLIWILFFLLFGRFDRILLISIEMWWFIIDFIYLVFSIILFYIGKFFHSIIVYELNIMKKKKDTYL